VTGRVSNLFDKYGFTTISDQKQAPPVGNPYWASVIRPRTFALELGVKF
jgi:hypothetical protein